MKKLLSLIFILIVGVAVISCDVSPSGNTTTINSSNAKVFTLSELAQYDGSNGSTAYIAVNGTVYDVTNVFVNGVHQGMHLGGTDATAAFNASPHSMSLLNTLPVVGVLQTSTSLTSSPNTTTTQGTTQGTTTQDSTVQTMPIFTLSELSQYTGANGSTAYIAVNGVIYDVTNVFVNGTHQGLQLGGTDASAAFASSPHSMSLLDTLPVVGTLEGYDPIVISGSQTTTTTQSTTTQSTSTQTMPIFTLNELSQYTGANGSTAYIAVNGVVYDVTNVFVNGTHQGLQLGGTDATAAFASSPHSASLLNSLPVVGSLEGYAPIVIDNSQTSTSTTTQYHYDDDDDEHDDENDDLYDD